MLFQLPNVQQTGTQSQSQAVLTTINQPVSLSLIFTFLCLQWNKWISIILFRFMIAQNQYRYTNVMNHGVLPQTLEQQIQVKQPPAIQTNQLPPNAHFQAIQTQNPCQQEQDLTSINNVTQQPQVIQPQTQNNMSNNNNNNNNNSCIGAQDQSNVTTAPHKTKKVMEKSRRERKTIARQASTPNTNTAMQQLAVNTQSPLVIFDSVYIKF